MKKLSGYERYQVIVLRGNSASVESQILRNHVFLYRVGRISLNVGNFADFLPGGKIACSSRFKCSAIALLCFAFGWLRTVMDGGCGSALTGGKPVPSGLVGDFARFKHAYMDLVLDLLQSTVLEW